MIHNYIRNVSNYYKGDKNLSFFSYIAGGFCKTINAKILSLADEATVSGSAISVSNMIELIRKQRAGADLGHDKLQSIFSLNREITWQDIIRL